MTEAKFTPGPWEVGPVDDTVVTHIGADGVRYEVAAIDGDYNDPDKWPIMEANARLIAAAPDLYAALTKATTKLEHAMVMLGSDPEFAAIGVEEFRAALSKAGLPPMTQNPQIEALKPCPFCGSAPEVERIGSARASMIVACTDCGARMESALREAAAPSEEPVAPTFQDRVQPWMMACFGAEISGDKVERGDRLLEEVLELLQSGGYDPARVGALRDYVWGRPAGEPAQEVGGVMVTLAAYCLAFDQDMHAAGETELARIWTKVDKIRAKQAAKPVGSALPVASPAVAPVAVSVKGLPWDDKEYSAQAVVTALGLTYTLQHGRDGWFAAVTGAGISEYIPGDHPDREPAKAAAQSDFNARITDLGRRSLSQRGTDE